MVLPLLWHHCRHRIKIIYIYAICRHSCYLPSNVSLPSLYRCWNRMLKKLWLILWHFRYVAMLDKGIDNIHGQKKDWSHQTAHRGHLSTHDGCCCEFKFKFDESSNRRDGSSTWKHVHAINVRLLRSSSSKYEWFFVVFGEYYGWMVNPLAMLALVNILRSKLPAFQQQQQ